jgi:hypothetical protein
MNSSNSRLRVPAQAGPLIPAKAGIAALAAVSLLAASLGLKAAFARPEPSPAARQAARVEVLRRFLAANASGPVTPVTAAGWRVGRPDGCRLLAFPSSERSVMDMVALGYRRPQDRVLYVYKGHPRLTPPTAELALDVIVYKAARPFRGGLEPGYIVVIIKDCPQPPPPLPWAKLG